MLPDEETHTGKATGLFGMNNQNLNWKCGLGKGFLPLFLLFVLASIVSSNCCAQDKYRNKGLYNITQYSFAVNYDVAHTLFLFHYTPEQFPNSHVHEIHTELGAFVIKKHMTAGLGIGFAQYKNPDITTLPVEMVFRLFANKVDNSLYLLFRANGAILVRNHFRIATGIKAGLGYKFFMANKCFVADLFWQLQTISMTPANSTFSLDKYELRSIGFSIGVMPF